MTTATEPGRVRTAAPPTFQARCHGCAWHSTAANALGNAARHHDAHGHAVTVHLHRRITYGDPSAPLPGQLAIEDDR